MSGKDAARPDLDSPERIAAFVDAFYARVFADPQLAPIFLDVAQIDPARHLPLIRAYWEKLLLGRPGYQRHTMDIHRALHARRPLRAGDFARWLELFRATLDDGFEGPGAERAWRVAQHVATNMGTGLAGD
ncbi:MAG: hypothetical protein CALGDGBN_02204 [Pseudomonadales bacterium]|nr:hypothetical protein [Pseudomonadales bacterium]